MKPDSAYLWLVGLGVLVLALSFGSTAPTGGEVTFIQSQGPNLSAGAGNESNMTAIAGNLTEIIISIGQSGGGGASQTWTGYYGNVSGTIQVGDGSDNIFYNWSTAEPLGEVFASVNDSIIWTNIQCFNFTAAGSFADDSGNAGATSQFGLNGSQANSQYNIADTDADAINNTFGVFDHPQFFVNSLEFAINECPSTKILNNTGQGAYNEVLLYAPDNQDMVFAGIINQDTIGFDGKPHDFQMIVPEDGHGADTSTTDYFFYVEIG